MRPFKTAILTIPLLAALSGCATTDTPEESAHAPYTIPSQAYHEVFNRAIRTLRDAHFTIDRVDAREGLITTRPSPSAGFATPWREHALTAEEARLNLVHQEQRVATITFSPADHSSQRGDLRNFDGDLRVQARVKIDRFVVVSKRHDSSGVRFSHVSTGRKSGESVDEKPVRILSREDPVLADLLLRGIQNHTQSKQISVND